MCRKLNQKVDVDDFEFWKRISYVYDAYLFKILICTKCLRYTIQCENEILGLFYKARAKSKDLKL